MKSSRYSFGILRLFFALLIVYFHNFILGGFGVEPINQFLGNQIDMGSLAVSGFFVISGFLVSGSLESSRNSLHFTIKRFLRLMPGFWMCLLVITFGFAPLIYFIEYGSLSGFKVPFYYLTGNAFLLMRHHQVGDILMNNPYPQVINGSLWTLFFEAKAYGVLGLLGILKLNTKQFVMGSIFISLWLLIVFGVQIPEVTNKYLRLLIDPGFIYYLTYFFGGSMLYLNRKRIKPSKTWLVILVFSLIVITLIHQLKQLLPIIFPLGIYFAAIKLPLKGFGSDIDVSYGIFLYAFPVQQLLTLVGLNRSGWLYFGASVAITLLLALISWHGIEKPALKFKEIFWTIDGQANQR